MGTVWGVDVGRVVDVQDWQVVDVPAVIEDGDLAIPLEQSGEIVVAGVPTIEDILEAFQRWMRLDVGDGHASPETLRAYFCDVKQHLEWLADEGLTVMDAGEEVLKEYRAWLVENYAISTCGRKLAGVRRFYEMAHARGALPRNPAARLKSPKDKTDRSERIKYLSFEAVKRILALPVEMNTGPKLPQGLRDRAMLILMAMHGLRVIEVHRLTLGNFDAGQGQYGSLRVKGKGDKYRTILLTDESRSVLDLWLKARDLMRLNLEAFFVTLNAGSEPGFMSRRAIRATVDKYMAAAGVKREGMSCHALRHSYATLSLAMGASLLAISGSMGHASITTTQVYAKIVDRDRHNPAKLLGGLLG